MADRQMILDLIAECRQATKRGSSLAEIRSEILSAKLQLFLIHPADFLAWIREDREFSYAYFDVQQSGACAKPAEVVAMVLETIILETLEHRAV